MKFWETSEQNIKLVNGIRVISTYTPEQRPTYKQWIKEMKIGHSAWYHDPNGRQRAEIIMNDVGVEVKTQFESFKESIFGE